MTVLKSFLVNCWNNLFDFILTIEKLYLIFKDFVYIHICPGPTIISIEDTIKHVASSNCSVSRFGDGEIALILEQNIGFQKKDHRLGQRLEVVLCSHQENHIVCLPGQMSNIELYDSFTQKCWRNHFSTLRRKWEKYIDKKQSYYNTDMTRCYIGLKDKSQSQLYFSLLKQIWSERDLCIIEGEATRLGIGNNLFSNAKSITRILCPAKDAFSSYDKILDYAKTLPKESLILIALGPTATVLSYDLSKLGYQAIDIGHVDVEYEWFLAGVTKKIALKNKYVNEVPSGRVISECCDPAYLSQIIARIDC